MNLTEREKKFVTYGAVAWGLILLTVFVFIPWHERRQAEKEQLQARFKQLSGVKKLINKRAELAGRESSLISVLLNQSEVHPYGRQIVEVQTMLENTAKRKGLKITDTRPVKTAVISRDLGLRKATIKLTATAGDPKRFAEFLVDLYSMAGLLNIEEFSMQLGPQRAKGINFDLTVSTLVKEEE